MAIESLLPPRYLDLPREDILRMVPADGQIIGSIGCSRGATEQVLVKQGREVHGVDVDSDAIDVAKTRLSSARVVEPDELRPFGEMKLDGLILADVIEHIPRAWEFLRQFAMSVKPGGWVIISVPNMRSPRVFSKLFLKGDWEEAPMGIFDSTHLQVMTRRRLLRWCDGAGLVPERWFDHPGPFKWERRVNRICDLLSLRLLHEFFTFEHQVVCRKAL